VVLLGARWMRVGGTAMFRTGSFTLSAAQDVWSEQRNVDGPKGSRRCKRYCSSMYAFSEVGADDSSARSKS